MKADPAMRADLARCPNCALAIPRSRVVCPGCGSILPIEGMAVRLRAALPILLAATARQTQTRPLHVLLWLLASIPLLIGPPLVAVLVIGFRAWRFRAEDRKPELPVAILCVAVLNIGLSVLFWRVAVHDLWRSAAWIMDMLGARPVANGLRVQI